jgi:hypothetical protein
MLTRSQKKKILKAIGALWRVAVVNNIKMELEPSVLFGDKLYINGHYVHTYNLKVSFPSNPERAEKVNIIATTPELLCEELRLLAVALFHDAIKVKLGG